MLAATDQNIQKPKSEVGSLTQVSLGVEATQEATVEATQRIIKAGCKLEKYEQNGKVFS